MKFAQQLRQGAVEGRCCCCHCVQRTWANSEELICILEWRRAYVDYRLLKKLIKAAARSQEAGAEAGGEGEASDTAQPLNLPSPPDSSFSRNNGRGHLSSSDEDGLGPFQRIQVARVQSRSSARQQHDVSGAEAPDLRRRKTSSRPQSLRECMHVYALFGFRPDF